MTTLPSVDAIAVVIPARDEERLIGGCLTSVLRSLAAVPLTSHVVLVDHGSTDRTAAVAADVLGTRGTVIGDRSRHVSGARRRGVVEALRHFRAVDPARCWLLSTDADTQVPETWVRDTLGWAARGFVAVAGTAELDAWHGSLPALARYRQLIADGLDGETHRHAYAANLAVRSDAYLDAGGWPDVTPGEEHALLTALAARGWGVHRPTDLVVVTSGRRHSRARGGLGDLLVRLSP